MIELGISTFGETTEIEETGITPTHDERIRELIEEMKLADEVGLDIYAIGEHHRKDFAVSAPEIILAAGAAVTKNIKLSSAVTVLSLLIQYGCINNMQLLMPFQMDEVKLW